MEMSQRMDKTIETPGYGWITFSGVMLILVGSFNIIEGIAAIANSDYLVNQLLFANLDAWGWFFLIWGIIQVIAGFAVFGGSGWAVFVGVVTAFFNLIAQLSWARAYPVWAVCAMVVDVLVIYGLIVYGGRRDTV
jgi:C4-dicarboxylate transporter